MSENTDVVYDIANYGNMSSSVELLLLFQRLLLGNLYAHSSSSSPPPSSSSSSSQTMATGPSKEDQQSNELLQGAIAVLFKYLSMLHHHVTQVLPMATQLVSLNPALFKAVSQALCAEGLLRNLLPELAVGMVVLILKVQHDLVQSKCVPLLGELVKVLDDYNRLSPSVDEDEETDLAWPDAQSENTVDYYKGHRLLHGLLEYS